MHRVILSLLAVLLWAVQPTAAQQTAPDAAGEAAGNTAMVPAPESLLLVQTAEAMRFDGEILTLEGIPPVTLFFSDRPYRLTGHIGNDRYVQLWSAIQDSFSADPPNAALALLDEPGKPPIVVELMTAALDGDQLSYKVRVLDGELPAESGPVSLFIDPPPPHWGPGPGPGRAWGPGPWRAGPWWGPGPVRPYGPPPGGCWRGGLWGPFGLCY